MKKKSNPVRNIKPAPVANLGNQAFDNSLLANVVCRVSDGQIVLTNNAACKLLGHSKRALLTKTRSFIFDTSERSFKTMMKQRAAGGHAVAFVTAIRKNGKRFPCEITSAVFTDEDGIKKSITTIADMTLRIKQQHTIDRRKEKIVSANIAAALVKAEATLAENANWKKNIGIKLYDVMWDWNIATGEIFVGDSLEEVFGYRVTDNTTTLAMFKDCLLPAERTGLERRLFKTLASQKKSWSEAYSFKRFDGQIALTTCRAGIVRDSEGKATHLIGAMLDITRVEELQKKLDEEINTKTYGHERFHLAAKLSFDGIWDWNLLSNKFFLGEGFEDLFGYSSDDTLDPSLNWTNYLHPDDKTRVEKELQDAIASTDTYWEKSYRFIRADGSSAEVLGRANIIRLKDGKACRMIGVTRDLSRQKELEDQLSEELKRKQKEILEAARDAKDVERADIGKELHDNVNQLLGASKLYMDLAMGGGEAGKIYIGRSTEYTLTAIEEIRKLTRKLTSDIIHNGGLFDAIEKTIRDTMEIYPLNIVFTCLVPDENTIHEKLRLTIFRIIQEQLNNILKHAHAANATIDICQRKKIVELTIADNGIGFDTTIKQKGIGISNIKNRVANYNGTSAFISAPGKGCILRISMPLTNNYQKKRACKPETKY